MYVNNSYQIFISLKNRRKNEDMRRFNNTLKLFDEANSEIQKKSYTNKMHRNMKNSFSIIYEHWRPVILSILSIGFIILVISIATNPVRSPQSKCSSNNKKCGKWKPDGSKGECGVPTILNNILGGAITKLGEFPYVTLLNYKLDGKTKYLCGGSLINKWYVLTAAHCISENQPEEVVLGDYVLDPNSDPDCTKNACAPKRIVKKIAKMIKHEQFSVKSDGQFLNDIALIRLQESIPLHNEDATISISSPICLPWKQNDSGRFIKENSKTVIAGFGQVTNKGVSQNLSNLRKQEKTMRKTELKLCSDYSSTELCGKGSKGDSNGDLGGALLFREFSGEPWFQVGILSSFTRRYDENKPATYTKVEPFLTWIESNLEL